MWLKPETNSFEISPDPTITYSVQNQKLIYEFRQRSINLIHFHGKFEEISKACLNK